MSDATCLVYGGIFSHDYIADFNAVACDGRILKIIQ